MFGYITVNKEELKPEDYQRYRGYYCGLCRELGKQHGQLSRLTLTYDMTFLILLLTGLYEAEPIGEQRRCPLHPASPQPALNNAFTRYAADMNILLAYYNLKDDWTDEKKLSSFLMSGAVKKTVGKISAQYPVQAAAVVQYMEKLSACEKEMERGLDTAAGYTGELLGSVLSWRQDDWTPGLYRLGFYLGKFIYLCDAYEDLNRDKRSGNYNPLIYYADQTDFEEHTHTILTMMAAECAREFEKLPILMEADILRNILYSGIWTRYQMTAGKRREQSKKP